MPIEIKELVIRATVDPGEGGGETTGHRRGAQSGNGPQLETDEIVQACVEQVMEILRRERER